MSWIKDFAVPAICLIACTPLAAMAWNQNGPSTRSDSEMALRAAEANAMQTLRGMEAGLHDGSRVDGTPQELIRRLSRLSRGRVRLKTVALSSGVQRGHG
jgi:hypothetical protein